MFGLSSRLDGWRAIWPFFVKVLFTLFYINSSNLIENDHNFVFLTVKYQLKNTHAWNILSQVKFQFLLGDHVHTASET